MMRAIFLFLLTTLFCAWFHTALFAQNPGQTAPLDAASARQLIAESMTLYDSGQVELSIERAELAYRFFHKTAGSNPSDLADAAYQSGRALYKKPEYGQAIPRFEEAGKVLEALHPSGSVRSADAVHYVSRCLYRLDRPDAALQVCLRAYEMRQNHQPLNPCDLAESLRMIGNIYLELGKYLNGIKYYEEALPLEKACSGEEGEGVADILGNMGYAWNLQGNFQKSIAIQEQTLTIRQKLLPPDHLDLAYSYHTLGFVYKSLLKYQESLQYFEKALKIRRKKLGNAHLDIANTYSEMGRAQLGLGEYQQARISFEKSNDVMIQIKDTNSIAYGYVCADMGQVNFGLKNYPESIKWHEKTVAFRRKVSQNFNSPLASALVQLATARLANNDFEAALADLLEAKLIWETLFGTQTKAASKAYAGLANTYRKWYLKTGQDNLLEKARYNYRLAEKSVEESMRAETYSDAQKKVQAEAVSVFEKAIGAEILFLKAHNNDPAALQKAWQLSEAMHSYLLFSATQEANAKHFAGIPDEELSRDSVIRAQITVLEKKRRSLIERQGLNLTDSLVLAASVQISAKKEESLQLLALFEKRYPDYFRLKYQLETSSLEKTQRLLSPQQTLLEYFTGDSSIFVFLVQHQGSQVIEIPRDFPLNNWVQSFREGISGYHAAAAEQKTSPHYQKTVRQYADVAQKLYEKLLAPLAGSLTTEIIIVPGDGLSNLPFEALLSATPKDLTNFNTYPFLLRSHTVQYAYSATMLHQMTDRQHPQATAGGLLAFAPFFEEDTSSLALRLDRDGAIRLGLSALPFSGEEVIRAKKRFEGQSAVLTGKMASKQKFLELAAKYKVLHLATHGKANHLAGDFSYLAFAPQDENSENSLLSVGDLYNLPLNADLVLLSACETGIGEQQRGEGVVSLARAFAYAGAKSIVASLWSVNDKSTMQLMDSFYAGIKSGKQKNMALANAKLQYLEKNPGQASHPFFWAAFVAVGDMAPIKN